MRFLLVGLLALWTAMPGAQTLEFTFIGNTAYEITDGETTLLLDFPYVSGYNGYMEYDLEKVKPKGDVLCLITHNHSDHFDSALYEKSGWSIYAPVEVLRKLKKPKAISYEMFAQFKDVAITAFKTPHSRVVHHSYLISWHGLRIFVAGDTPNYGPLLQQRELDVAFITPWLAKALAGSGRALDADKVVIYHHKDGEEKPPCRECIFPKQGESFEIDLANRM